MYEFDQWASIGYGINTWDIHQEDIDLEKLKKLFSENKYDINDIFELKEEHKKAIQKANSVEEILELKPLKEYWIAIDHWYFEHPLEQIVGLILEQKEYGFETAIEDHNLAYIYLPARMPWQMKETKNLTKENLESFIHESLKEIYKESNYKNIPKLKKVHCLSGRY